MNLMFQIGFHTIVIGPETDGDKMKLNSIGKLVISTLFLLLVSIALLLTAGCASTYQDLHDQETKRYYEQKDSWELICDPKAQAGCNEVPPTATHAPKEGEYDL